MVRRKVRLAEDAVHLRGAALVDHQAEVVVRISSVEGEGFAPPDLRTTRRLLRALRREPGPHDGGVRRAAQRFGRRDVLNFATFYDFDHKRPLRVCLLRRSTAAAGQ